MIDSFRGEYRFLSNFWECRVVLDGVVYQSVEHGYQAAKTLDPLERNLILKARTPGEAKRLSRTIRVRKDWDDVKLSVMRNLVTQKFSNPKLAEMLLKTGDEELVEGNSWGDVFWGVCNGVGENHLGKILMEVRSSLRK